MNKVEIYFVNGDIAKVKYIGDFNHASSDLSSGSDAVEYSKKMIAILGEINFYIISSMACMLQIYADKFKIQKIKSSSKIDFLNCFI